MSGDKEVSGFSCTYYRPRGVTVLKKRLDIATKRYGPRSQDLNGIRTVGVPGYDAHVALEAAWTLATDSLYRKAGREPDMPLMAGYTMAYMLKSVAPDAPTKLAEFIQLMTAAQSVWKLQRVGVYFQVKPRGYGPQVRMLSVREGTEHYIPIVLGAGKHGVPNIQSTLCAVATYLAMDQELRKQVVSWKILEPDWVYRLRKFDLYANLVASSQSEKLVCPPLNEDGLIKTRVYAQALNLWEVRP